MARINMDTLSKCEKERNSVHSKVSATYTIFTENGEKYLQIDTYGKSERKMPEKISQSIQFDKESAKFFAILLSEEFDLSYHISD